MKPSKIKKVGRRLYIYFKLPFFHNFETIDKALEKYYDDDSSMGSFIDETGKYIVIGYFLRSMEDVRPYIEWGNNK